MMGLARGAMDAAGMAPERIATGAAGDDELVAAVAARRPGCPGAAVPASRPLAGRAAGGQDLVPGAGRGGAAGHLLAAWRGARAYHGSEEVPAWLWGIARRRLASLARRQPHGSLSLDAAGERVDPASGPEEAALGRDASTRIRLAVAHLPDDQQAVITAVIYQGQTITQAARATRRLPRAPSRAACAGPPAHPQGAEVMTEHPTELLLKIADGATPTPRGPRSPGHLPALPPDPGGAGPARPGLCLGGRRRRAGRPQAGRAGTHPGRRRGAAGAGRFTAITPSLRLAGCWPTPWCCCWSPCPWRCGRPPPGRGGAGGRPLVAAAAVAFAYGPAVDPAYEAVACRCRRCGALLVRLAAVLVANTLLAGAVGLALDDGRPAPAGCCL